MIGRLCGCLTAARHSCIWNVEATARLLYLDHSGMELYNMPAQLKLGEHRSAEDTCFKNKPVSDDLPELL